MKKTLLSILSFATAASLSAQVTVTSADFPSAGTSVELIVDTMPTISVGSAGSSQTWDLTGVNYHLMENIDYVDMATKPYSAEFPNSNLAVDNAMFTNAMNVTTTEATINGLVGDPMGAGMIVTVTFNPTDKLIEFPAVMGQSFNDTMESNLKLDGATLSSQLSPTDSVWLKRVGTSVNTIDGDGTVNTPGGSFAAIRQYRTQTTTDSLFLKTTDANLITQLSFACTCVWPSGEWKLVPASVTALIGIADNPIVATTYQYNWYTNGEGHAVAEVSTDAANNPLRAKYLYKDNLLTSVLSETNAACTASCDGEASVGATGGSSAYTFTWDNGASTNMATGLCSGDHNVTISDGADTQILTVTIGEDPAWTASTTTTDASCGTCTDGSVTAIANGGTAPYTYAWSDAQTTSTATGLVAGSYTCTVTDALGCSAETSSATVTKVLDVVLSSNVSVFPNPTNGIVSVVSSEIVIESYTVYNTIGEMIFNKNVNANNVEIELNTLENGVYFINLNTAEGVVQKKITLMK